MILMPGMKTLFAILLLALVAGGAGKCEDGDGGDVDSDSDGDGDADTDSDSDSDSDGDGDSGCEWTCVYGGGGCPDDYVSCPGQTCPSLGSMGVGDCCGPPPDC